MTQRYMIAFMEVPGRRSGSSRSRLRRGSRRLVRALVVMITDEKPDSCEAAGALDVHQKGFGQPASPKHVLGARLCRERARVCRRLQPGRHDGRHHEQQRDRRRLEHDRSSAYHPVGPSGRTHRGQRLQTMDSATTHMMFGEAVADGLAVSTVRMSSPTPLDEHVDSIDDLFTRSPEASATARPSSMSGVPSALLPGHPRGCSVRGRTACASPVRSTCWWPTLSDAGCG